MILGLIRVEVQDRLEAWRNKELVNNTRWGLSIRLVSHSITLTKVIPHARYTPKYIFFNISEDLRIQPLQYHSEIALSLDQAKQKRPNEILEDYNLEVPSPR